MTIKRFSELSAAEIYEILKARSAVFMIEQGIRYLDMDDVDYRAFHLFDADEEGHVLRYMRLYPDEKDRAVLRFGRVLSNPRRKGGGRALLLEAQRFADAKAYSVLRCDAQLPVVPFYQKCGFRTVSEPFSEAGILHVLMEKACGGASEVRG